MADDSHEAGTSYGRWPVPYSLPEFPRVARALREKDHTLKSKDRCNERTAMVQMLVDQILQFNL